MVPEVHEEVPVVGDDRGEHGALVALGALAAIATILTFVFQFGPFGGSSDDPTPHPPAACTDATPSLSKGTGPSGTQVTVTGSGFPGDRDVDLRFHTEAMAPAHSDAEGHFKAHVTIPGTFDFAAPAQFDIVATTAGGGCFASRPFQLTR